jgi:hypothetical protein
MKQASQPQQDLLANLLTCNLKHRNLKPTTCSNLILSVIQRKPAIHKARLWYSHRSGGLK